jgi:triphosphoribosyl-dephospho-CoA synthase
MACLLEVTARKPGNVHRGADFADSHYIDFLLSASALVGPMDRAEELGVGATVLESVEATRRVVASNTNLGMILLLAPLASVSRAEDARSGVQRVLGETTIKDCRLVYQAIRLARPGGLGASSEQDVEDDPTVSLIEAMRLGSERDLIAAQYANGFREVFDVVSPSLKSALDAGRDLETAIIFAQLSLMSKYPDSLISRKRGRSEATESSRRAAVVLASGWPERREAASELEELDSWLRAVDHERNPGTSADLAAAALFIALRDGTIALPLGPEAFGRNRPH